ncbi:MAG TPA: glycosyltransferase family 2 protein [Bacteroidia bacterium]|jgi:glycosyltransferase involved in cell wall biosynthesis
MKLISESGSKTASPFFSVCIETHNRGGTIYRALESLLQQGIDNFECVLVDDCSNDETLNEVKRFIASSSYSAHPFLLKVYQNENHLGGVLNWNSPLEFATGKYIAVLEGDDYFQAEHLKKAQALLFKMPNVGIYATGSQRALRPLKGLIPAKEYFQYTYQIINVSPPSETIFIRLDKSGVPWKYDVTNNSYAPELQLLLAISSDGWDAFHTTGADVYREPSTSNTNMSWKYFDDKFKIIKKYKNHSYISDGEFRQSFKRQFVLSVRRYLVSDFQKKGKPESIRIGIEKVLVDKDFEGVGKYRLIFSLIIFLKKIKFFAFYFSIKKKTA